MNNKLFEIANIYSAKSGLSCVVQIRPGERYLEEPHIRYLKNIYKADTEYIKLSLSNDIDRIRIIESNGFKISCEHLTKVKEFIKINYDVLFHYYKEAEFLDTGDFILRFKKV